MRPHWVNCSTNTVGERLSQEEHIVMLHEAEKDRENRTELWFANLLISY